MKVKNMTSPRTGREVPNQFVIYNDGKTYFQSYNSLIAEWDGERLTLGRDYDYSVTTIKYLHMWIDKYCPYSLSREIANAPGGSYSKKLKWLIDNDGITYNCLMV